MKLQEKVAAKYRIKTIRPGKYNFPEYGTIDLQKINLQRADELVAKGFPFLILREEPLKIIKKESQKPEQKIPISKRKSIPIIQLRKNKSYINKLLSMNWSDLSFIDTTIFDKSEKLFLEKKTLFIENSDILREMRSLHAKMKVINPDSKNNEKRKKLIQRLSKLDDKKATNWKKIDTWIPKKDIPETKENDTQKAVRIALKKDKMIRTHKVYIYRAQKTLKGMKSDTAKQRSKIEIKKKEIKRRKKELKEMGVPYE